MGTGDRYPRDLAGRDLTTTAGVIGSRYLRKFYSGPVIIVLICSIRFRSHQEIRGRPAFAFER